MKKRRLFAVVVLVLLAALSLIVTACDSTTYYTVTLDYETSQGTVSLTPAAENGKYAEGTLLTLSVVPNNGFEVSSFTVSGYDDAVLDEEGKYIFNVQADTTVTVTFKRTYTVTLDYETSQGKVSLEPSSENGKYAEGTDVTLSVVPNNGYEVTSFAVSGKSDAALDEEGKYTFNVQADTTVTVTFAMLTFEKAFVPLQGSVLFEGQFINHDYGFGEEVTMDYSILFDAEAKAIWQTEKDGDSYNFNAIYKDNGGKIALVAHNEEGKVVLYDSPDNFADYFNPFAFLTPEDFTEVEDSVWELAADKVTAAATAITGYEEEIASFRIWFENGVFTKLQIKTVRVVNEDKGIDFEYEYLYDIKDVGTANIPAEWLADYTMTPEHETLKKALEKAAAASSYTISKHSIEIGYESEDLDLTMYVTQDAIYEELAGEENGYIELDGAVYPFTYDPKTEETSFDDALGIDSIDYLKAFFTFEDSGLSYSLMGYDGDGKYSVRIPDLFIMDEYGKLAGAVASLFAVGADQIQYYPYAIDCTIILKEDTLYQVCFTYDLMGYISEQVTLTFSEFGSTTLPIEIKGEPEPSETGIPKEYVGTFKGEKNDTTYEVDITAEGITVKIGENSYPATIDDYSDYYGFTLTVNNTIYYLYSYGHGEIIDQLVLEPKDESMMIFLAREGGEEQPGPSETNIPQQYIGVFKGEDNGTAYEIDITAEGITVKIGGTSYTATIDAYDEYEGFTLTVDGKEYYLLTMDYQDPTNKILLMDDGSMTVTLTRDGTVA